MVIAGFHLQLAHLSNSLAYTQKTSDRASPARNMACGHDRCRSCTAASDSDSATAIPTPSGPAPALSQPLPPAKLPGGVLLYRCDFGSQLVGERYDLKQELGRGSYGVTRLAVCSYSGRHLACKTVIFRTPMDEADVALEVLIMASLPPHRSLVRLLEVYQCAHRMDMVMELCDGGTLVDLVTRLVDRNLYSEDTAAILAWTVAEVLRVLHAAGVIHRDIKPTNFVHNGDLQIKAIDFGFALLFNPGERFNEMVGTLEYMAPEVLRGDYYGPEADIWSAGVMIYELICGHVPFMADTDEGVVKAILTGKLDLECHPWPKFPDARDLVAQMLRRNPARRPTAHRVRDHKWLLNRIWLGSPCPLHEHEVTPSELEGAKKPPARIRRSV